MTGMIYPAIVMGGLGVIFGSLLAYASKKFYVEVDPRQAKIRALLPGANCGGCGYPGCDGYADACASGKAPLNRCAAAGAAVAAKIAEIMGAVAETSEPQVAFVKCKATTDKRIQNCIYDGVKDCREAVVVPGKGPSACAYGCMGLGTCVKVCNFGAIRVVSGLAVVNPNMCVGCGACVAECPRGVITLVPKKSKIHVACSNPLKGPFVKKVCTVGCIGCTMCAKVCPKKAIEMKDSIAVIDSTKCVNCGLCAMKCPVKAIKDERPPRPPRPAPKPAAAASTSAPSAPAAQ